MPSRRVRAGSSYADWLLMALLHHPDSGELCRLAGCEVSGGDGSSHFSIQVESLHPGKKLGKRGGRPVGISARSWDGRGPSAAVCFPVPQPGSDPHPHQNGGLGYFKGAGEGNHFIRRPKFLIGKGLTGAERGNAVHKFMQFASL